MSAATAYARRASIARPSILPPAVQVLRGKYVLERRLGGGGMAEVFLARTIGAEGFSRPVAIKRVLPQYSDHPMFAQMFVAEARLSARLQHPNVVSVLDFDRDEAGQLYLVMELVEGVDLERLAASGELPLPAVAFVIGEVLRGLGHAHALPVASDGVRGLIHRDVSPQNVLLSWEGAVKVSDFGIAKARTASQATATEMVKGKPAYMSPEQANGGSLDSRSDLFAVGVMLWELACGRPLFAASSTHETLARLLFGQVPPPRTLRGDLSPQLDQLTMRLLARDCAQRPASAEAALAELVACPEYPRSGRELVVELLRTRCTSHAGPVPAGPHDPTRASVPAPSSAPAVTPMQLTPPTTNAMLHTARRSRWWLWLALVVAACAVTVVALMAFQRGADRRESNDVAPSAAVPERTVAVPADAAVVDDASVTQAAVGSDANSSAPSPDAVTPALTSSSTPKPSRGGSRSSRGQPARAGSGSGSASRGIQELELGKGH